MRQEDEMKRGHYEGSLRQTAAVSGNGNGDHHEEDRAGGVLRLTERRPETVGTSVVIPAYNEEGGVADVVRRVKEVLGPHDEIIVVDDGSSDDTAEAATEAGATVVRRPYNFGNGSAIKTGARVATGDKLVMLDADGQHDPAVIPTLLRRLDTYDLVVAAREPGSQATVWRRAANGVFNGLASHLTNHKIADLTSGYRAIRRDILEEFLPLLPNQFSYPTTTTLACLRAGYTVDFVPIEARKRSGAEKSKIKPISDGLKFLTIILKIITLFAPMRVFGPLSVAPLTLGALSFGVRLVTGKGASTTGALLLMAGLVLFCMGLISEQITALRFERHDRHALA